MTLFLFFLMLNYLWNHLFLKYKFKIKRFIILEKIHLGIGDGDWGLGIGDWGLGPIPNPQSPIPNPQSPH